MMRKLAGFLMIVLGIIQGLWIAYNLFIERLPEFPPPAFIGLTGLAGALITVGLTWLRTSSTSGPKD